MKLPQEIITKYVEDNFDFKWNSSKTEMRINSPFSSDRKFHCYINPVKGKFIDYKTNLQGSFIVFVKEYMDLNTYKETENYLYKNYFNINLFDKILKTEKNEFVKEGEIVIPEFLKLFDGNEGIIGKKALKYLINRGFPKDKIQEFKMGYICDGKFKNRIFVPIIENRKIVYFMTRTFVNSPLRYLYPENLNSKNFVFNYDKIGETLGITEGILDAISLDYPICTASLSVSVSEAQVKKILSIEKLKNIIFIPDNDLASFRSLEHNWQIFVNNQTPNRKIKYFVYELKKYKDINESNIKTIHLSECKELSRSYFLYLERKLYDYKNETGNISLINK